MHGWCWAVCRTLRQELPPLVRNISSQYLLSPSLHLLFLQFTLSSKLTATALPALAEHTGTGRVSGDGPIRGLVGAAPTIVTPSTDIQHACPVTACGHTTQPQDCTAETFAELQPSFGLLLMLGRTKGWHWFYCLGLLETLQSSALFKIA